MYNTNHYTQLFVLPIISYNGYLWKKKSYTTLTQTQLQIEFKFY
jgi:hypothetical protein